MECNFEPKNSFADCALGAEIRQAVVFAALMGVIQGGARLHSACADLDPARKLLICPGQETCRGAEEIEAPSPLTATAGLAGSLGYFGAGLG